MIKATDLYFAQIIKLMIQDLRKNRFLINDILSDVTSDPILKELYGQKEVEKFNLLVDKDIQINVEHAIDVSKFPAIAIRVGGGSEETGRTGDALGDGFYSESVKSNTLGGVFKTPRIMLGPVTPESFDYITGKMVFTDNVSLASVFDGMLVYDELNKKEYPIITVMDNSTLFIEPGLRPNLTNMTIRSATQTAIHTRRNYFTSEQVTLICAAVDPVDVIYLYQILMYQIGRHRVPLLEGKNFKNGTLSYTPIYKLTDDPNIIYAREITLNGIVEHSYIENTQRPIDGLAHDLRINNEKTPDAIVPIVSNQGWSSENDE